jgi:hypothetical protein
MILSHVPSAKLSALSQDFIEAVESEAVPETLGPQTVDAFYQRVALGLGSGDEDQLYTKIEAQPDEGTEAARSLVSTRRGGVIVDLKEVR